MVIKGADHNSLTDKPYSEEVVFYINHFLNKIGMEKEKEEGK